MQSVSVNRNIEKIVVATVLATSLYSSDLGYTNSFNFANMNGMCSDTFPKSVLDRNGCFRSTLMFTSRFELPYLDVPTDIDYKIKKDTDISSAYLTAKYSLENIIVKFLGNYQYNSLYPDSGYGNTTLSVGYHIDPTDSIAISVTEIASFPFGNTGDYNIPTYTSILDLRYRLTPEYDLFDTIGYTMYSNTQIQPMAPYQNTYRFQSGFRYKNDPKFSVSTSYREETSKYQDIPKDSNVNLNCRYKFTKQLNTDLNVSQGIISGAKGEQYSMSLNYQF